MAKLWVGPVEVSDEVLERLQLPEQILRGGASGTEHKVFSSLGSCLRDIQVFRHANAINVLASSDQICMVEL